MSGWAWLSAAIVAEIAATLAHRAFGGFTRPVPVALLVVGIVGLRVG